MFGTYCRLHVHVSASDITVIRAVRRKFKPKARRDPAQREARKSVYRAILAHHHNAARTFRSVMGGV